MCEFGRMSMQIRLTLKPGQKGTKRLVAQYGHQLVCVRYRYDEKRKKRFKTVELIIDEVSWGPQAARLPDAVVVEIKVKLGEVGVRERVKEAGGRWNPEKNVWELRYDRVVKLGLEERIVGVAGI